MFTFFYNLITKVITNFIQFFTIEFNVEELIYVNSKIQDVIPKESFHNNGSFAHYLGYEETPCYPNKEECICGCWNFYCSSCNHGTNEIKNRFNHYFFCELNLKQNYKEIFEEKDQMQPLYIIKERMQKNILEFLKMFLFLKMNDWQKQAKRVTMKV